jgi:hypothetical protein
MDGVLAPQRVTRGVHGGDAEARVDDLETSQVIRKKKVFEVTSDGEEASTEVGLKVLIVTVGGVVISTATALEQVPRKWGQIDDLVGL